MKLGPYELGEPLGEGGMGVVVRARHADTGQAVALKRANAATPEQRARFRREAAIGARLNHPGIVRVLDHDADGDPPWLAMQLVEGEPLGGWARRTRPDWRTAVTIAREVAQAVQAAHDAGVVHRDLKPGNVLIGRSVGPEPEAGGSRADDAVHGTGQSGSPSVFLTDFGLARESAADTKLTATGDALGTPAYMSPEQARGDLAQVGPATDIWSLGALCYELCAHRPPFTGDGHAAVLAAVLHGPLPDATGLDAPAGLARLLAGCLQRNPRARYASAAAFAADCDRLLAGEPVQWRSAGSRRGTGATATAFAVAVVAAVVALPLERRSARARAAGRQAAEGWALRHHAPDRARALLEAAARDHPGLHRAQLHRGLVRWTGGDFEGALAAWHAIPQRAPERAHADLCTALVAFFHIRPNAERAAAYARLPDDDSPAGRIGRALHAVHAKDWSRARRALAGIPGWEAALLRGYVESLAPDGAPADAVRELDAAFTAGVKPIWAVLFRGRERARAGDLQGALEDFATLVSTRPRNALFRRDRAYLYEDAGDLDRARADADLAVELAPDDWQAWRCRSRIRTAQGDFAGALADNREACRLHPGEPDLLYDQAGLHSSLGDAAAALAIMNAAVAAAPANAAYLARRALLHHRLRRLNAALADATAAIALAPDHAVAHHARARIHRTAGREQEALADLRRAAALAPDDALVRLDLGISLDRVGKTDGAVAAYRAALERRPRFPEALGNLGMLLLRLGRPREALPLLDRFLARYPDHRAAPMVAKARAKAAAATGR